MTDADPDCQIAQYPTNYLMQWFLTSKYLTINFILC